MTDENKPELTIAGEVLLVAWAALALAIVCTAYCFRHNLLLLYGDAVSHLYIARRVLDSRNPGFRQFGTVWLPLPHLLLLPFAAVSDWWRNGLAGAWVSVPSYALGCAGLYRLARVWLSVPIALVAVASYALNPGLLYLSTTAMTEPLYLALMIWAVLLLVLYQQALDGQVEDLSGHSRKGAVPKKSAKQPSAPRLLAAAGVVLVCAVFTRYDGWIFASGAWLLATLPILSGRRRTRPITRAWVLFTIVLAAAPAIWFLYNSRIFGDALYFMRGPSSARAIEARTSPPGAAGHPGSGSMRVSALYFVKAAEMGAVPLRVGNTLFWITIAGTLAALVRFRRNKIWPVLLLWLPLPFYAYAVAYASVPIFIPIWWPFSWYNTRYGMELLPAFALFGACFVDGLLFLVSKRRALGPGVERWAVAVLLLLIVLNGIVLLRAGPLVFREAQENSRSRIPFDHALANALLSLPGKGPILMSVSPVAGAIQQAGIPLKRIVSEGDNLEWQRALEDPAQAAPAVVALEGDPVAHAVRQHPQGLDMIEIVCSTGQPCARIYRSQSYTRRWTPAQ